MLNYLRKCPDKITIAKTQYALLVMMYLIIWRDVVFLISYISFLVPKDAHEHLASNTALLFLLDIYAKLKDYPIKNILDGLYEG